MKILLTGATGFVGGQLLPRLLDQGHDVRCFVRDPRSLQSLGRNNLDIVVGDACDFDSLRSALRRCDMAYYFIHSMNSAGDYRETDRHCAKTFARAAAEENLNRIIYLSGLANEEAEDLSDHLASRLEVGRILRGGEVPCIELRAAMVIGSGSLSFRMVEHLCKRLPLMLCPKWLSTKTQPIAIGDLLDFLTSSLELPTNAPRTIEIGGADKVTYMEILKEYCRLNGLKRIMIPVPFLSPQMSAYWLGLVTPETAKVGRAMIDGLLNPTFVRNPSAERLFNIKPVSVTRAIQEALGPSTKFEQMNSEEVSTQLCDYPSPA